MRKIVILAFALAMAGQLLAGGPSRVPAIKTPIARELPNGDTIMVRLHGDERRHWTTTVDGWMITEKDNGYFYYQKNKTDKNDKPIVSRRRAHNEEARCRCEKKWLTKYGKNYFIYE